MAQLMMQAAVPPDSKDILPEGYRFELFDRSEKDIADWKHITVEPSASEAEATAVYRRMIESFPGLNQLRDVNLLTNEAGERIGTVTLVTCDDGRGLVHAVKLLVQARGKGLSHAIARHALAVCRERGIETAWLTTDDWRLPAIKTYLDAGFRPVLYETPEADMKDRWDAVLQELKYPQAMYLVQTS